MGRRRPQGGRSQRDSLRETPHPPLLAPRVEEGAVSLWPHVPPELERAWEQNPPEPPGRTTALPTP